MAKHYSSVMEKFLSKVSPEPNTGCWLWLDSTGNGGYGVMSFKRHDGKWCWEGAHRVAYMLFKGPIPEGLHLDHKCRVRECCNPDHLEAVTRRENMRRGELGAIWSQTHCYQGHEYTPENTYIRRGTGKKQCRLCSRITDRKRWHPGIGRVAKSVSEGERDLRSEHLTDSIPCAVQGRS